MEGKNPPNPTRIEDLLGYGKKARVTESDAQMVLAKYGIPLDLLIDRDAVSLENDAWSRSQLVKNGFSGARSLDTDSVLIGLQDDRGENGKPILLLREPREDARGYRVEYERPEESTPVADWNGPAQALINGPWGGNICLYGSDPVDGWIAEAEETPHIAVLNGVTRDHDAYQSHLLKIALRLEHGFEGRDADLLNLFVFKDGGSDGMPYFEEYATYHPDNALRLIYETFRSRGVPVGRINLPADPTGSHHPFRKLVAALKAPQGGNAAA